MFLLSARSSAESYSSRPARSDQALVEQATDIGLRFGLDRHLTRTLRISFEYYRGLRDIGLTTDNHERYNNQFTIGVQYMLYR